MKFNMGKSLTDTASKKKDESLVADRDRILSMQPKSEKDDIEDAKEMHRRQLVQEETQQAFKFRNQFIEERAKDENYRELMQKKIECSDQMLQRFDY